MLLRFGSRGQSVRHAQASLNRLEPTRLPRLAEDGIFGGKTHARVLEFQGGNALSVDGIIGPVTLNVIDEMVDRAQQRHDPFDRNYRLPEHIFLNVAVVYLLTFKISDEMAKKNFVAAKELLEKYNLGIREWPLEGRRQGNVLGISEPIPDTHDAYVKLRKQVDAFLVNRAPRYPFVVPVVFGEFENRAKGITPHSSKIGLMSPLCLISMAGASVKDNLIVLHEMGHAALFPKATHNRTPGNIMHQVSGRDFLFRFQVEAYAKAPFAWVQ